MMRAEKKLLVTGSSYEDWIPLLELAAREVFELMLGCRLTTPETRLDSVLDITSVVGLAGKLRGVMSIRCSHKSAVLMASKMLGVEPDEVGPELCDALGEVCNMVAGNFKNKIPGLSEECMLSVPTIITGSDYKLRSLADSPALEMQLLFEGLPLVISLQVHS
jgi:chemotaxis protein CheX